MTTKEIELLISQWGTDPERPVLRNPWDRRNDPSRQVGAIRAALMNRPDFGWALAERLAGSNRACPLLKRREYRWIRAARNLHTGGELAAKHLRDVEVVAQARDLHTADEIRSVLNAALMTRDATARTVAEALKLKPEVVEAYSDLFFGVLDRKDDLAYMSKLLGRGKPDTLFIGQSTLPTEDEKLLAAGYEGTLEVVLRLAGFASGDQEGEGESEADLTKRLVKKILKAGVAYFDSPMTREKAPPAMVAHAIDIAKKSQMGLLPETKAEDLGDFASAARNILYDRKELLEKSIDQQLNQQAILR